VWAADRSPFWRERLAGRDLASFTESDLPSLPVLTRAEMMAEFDRVVTVPGLTLARVQQHLDQSDADRGYLDDEYQAIVTSGYIGTQAVHVYGWDAFVTFVMQGSRWTGRRGEDPEAVLAQAFATSTRHESGIFHAFSTFESGGPASHCSGGTQPLDEIVDGLNNARPAVQALQAWPSLMRELALESIAGRLTIKPTWVSVAGEVCTPPVREAVRSAWGIETSEFWGCSEGTYAFPCGVGEGMHVADDLVKRYVDVSPPRDFGAATFAQTVLVCLQAPRSVGERCIRRLRSLFTAGTLGALYAGVDSLLAGAEPYVRGELSAAARAWRPMVATGGWLLDTFRDPFAIAFDGGGDPGLAETIDRAVADGRGPYNGASLSHVRSALRAARLGDVARARDLAGKVLEAWSRPTRTCQCSPRCGGSR